MNDSETTKFFELLNSFETAMMASWNQNHHLHARPMRIAEIDSDGCVWFITGADSPKVNEIESNDRVLLTFQQDKDKYVSLSGRAFLNENPREIDRIWKEPFKVWFPEGKNDPNIILIKVIPELGEYWDNSGFNKARYLFEAAKSYVTNTTPTIQEPQEHGKVTL